MLLKQSTVYTRTFLLVQSADHLSGLTGATPTVNLSKAGGTFAAAGGTITEIANGFYKIALTTTDTGTVGDLAFHITATSGDATDFVDQVSATILGDTLNANTVQVNGNATAAANVAFSMNAIMRGTCTSGGSTTTAVTSAITSPASLGATGQLIGRTILFDANTTTAALQGQASLITASTTGATPTLTFSAMTTAPASGDTFSVV